MAAAKAFFRSGRTGEWRERLTEAQVARIAEGCEPGMRKFGYWLREFDALVPPRPGRLVTGS